MKALITVHMDNAAFDGAPNLELAAILETLVEELRSGPEFVERTLRDTNGNRVGMFKIMEGRK